jgi:hypothetical protein
MFCAKQSGRSAKFSILYNVHSKKEKRLLASRLQEGQSDVAFWANQELPNTGVIEHCRIQGLGLLYDTPTKRPSSKGPAAKGPATKGPATKGPGYERSGCKR